MSKHPSPEQLSGPLDVSESCQALFEVAYFKHLSDIDPAKHVQVAGDVEVIRLTNLDEPYDIVLGRPHLEAVADPDIVFWLIRINTIRGGGGYGNYQDLIVWEKDSSQFYIKQTETAEPRPFGVDASKEIVDYFNGAEVQDLGITSFG